MIDADVLNAAVDLVVWLIVVLAMLLLYKSVPASKISEGIELAKRGAAKTETPIDDSMIDFVEKLLGAYAARAGGVIVDVEPSGQPVAAKVVKDDEHSGIAV